jgi:predicted RNase H-like nuclease (RuvC/YqgF family)
VILAAEQTPLIVAVLAIVVAPLVGYIGATRKLSGKIATSEAGSLWEESRAIREDYARRLAECDARIQRLEARVRELETDNSALLRENFELTARLASALGDDPE